LIRLVETEECGDYLFSFFDKIDLLKIDVQGDEIKVLSGFSKSNWKRAICEFAALTDAQKATAITAGKAG